MTMTTTTTEASAAMPVTIIIYWTFCRTTTGECERQRRTNCTSSVILTTLLKRMYTMHFVTLYFQHKMWESVEMRWTFHPHIFKALMSVAAAAAERAINFYSCANSDNVYLRKLFHFEFVYGIRHEKQQQQRQQQHTQLKKKTIRKQMQKMMPTTSYFILRKIASDCFLRWKTVRCTSNPCDGKHLFNNIICKRRNRINRKSYNNNNNWMDVD